MFYVDDQYYSTQDLEQQFKIYEKIKPINECENLRIAICFSNAFQMISLCLFVRQKGGSVFPIHSQTPRDGAIRMANQASSHLLFFGTIDTMIELSNDKSVQEGFLIQMSSGTTGAPKCIERTWLSVEEEVESYTASLPVDASSKSIIACPITHSYGLISGFLACLKRGAEPVILTNLNPKYIIRKLGEFPKHIFYAAPALLHTLSRLMKNEQLFNYVMTSGTVMPSSWLSVLRGVSQKVLQQYGCSETGCVTIHQNLVHSQVMGYPLQHLKIEAGDENMPSEIIIHTKTKSIYTKDLGFIQNGVLSFLSRMDDTINVAGLNVYPQEVENVLMNEPRIKEAVVYKKYNKLTGERVCVQFVSKEEIEEVELREWCRKYLAPHQIPMEFNHVSTIEKLANGKVSRKKLAELLI
ncbi:fatty-acyl-CoA synthase [Metabacillus crassostreae]|uniref:AMP-binding protein n=1 Tax=Metabacillus crassostreae TaxID=929098 RepID=UPI00195E848B|nr:AMP-binding protein [Metabacillus crassostreae]MBM7603700.1 fatty-acyl-CoA synthase [Metabacillus crassostreae]